MTYKKVRECGGMKQDIVDEVVHGGYPFCFTSAVWVRLGGADIDSCGKQDVAHPSWDVSITGGYMFLIRETCLVELHR